MTHQEPTPSGSRDVQRGRTLTGRAGVVTGGGRGIGAAICAALVADGARVVALERAPQHTSADEPAEHYLRCTGMPPTAPTCVRRSAAVSKYSAGSTFWSPMPRW